MKTTMKINQMTMKVLLSIAALLFVMSINSAQNMHAGDEFALSGLIRQAYSGNNLPLKRNIDISSVYYNVLEAEVGLESWMTNSIDWKYSKNSVNLNYLLQEETEEPLQIENWMIKDFSKNTTGVAETENIPEESAKVEAWMLNPSTWVK